MRNRIGNTHGRDENPFFALRNLMRNSSGRASTTVAGIFVFLLGVGLTLFIVINPMKVGLFEKMKQNVIPGEETAAPPEAAGRKIKYWRAPMDPTYISDKPGKSPMGMDLIPVYEDEVEQETGIRIDPATVQNIGVVTDTVKRGDLRVVIRTVGTLDYNDNNIYWVNTKYDGWIEKVYVPYVGQPVTKGDPLFEVYSPDLVSTQEEYRNALKYRDKMAESGFPDAHARAEALLESSRKRLKYWDITESQIRRLERTGEIRKTLTVVSPVTGVVTEKMDEALEGMYAKAGMNLYKVADLSSLWVHVDVYEYQLPWIESGQQAEIEISYYPGEAFKGKVLFFYPYVDEKTRTIKVCVEIPNHDGRLRPEMYATVRFAPVAARNTVLVPDIAVLRTGKRDVVVLALGGGRFEPREVKLGLQGEGMFQVLEGLEGGEEIVTSSQFLIDSESNLREAIQKMLLAKNMADEPEAGVPATPDMAQPSEPTSLQGKQTDRPVIDDTRTIEEIETILQAYLPIWKALAKDSTEGIAGNSRKIAEAADRAAKRTELPTLKAQLEKLRDEASRMNADSLSGARESFKGLSRALLAVFNSHDVRMPKAYSVIECPMVKERWIQDTDQVSNPFMGSAMPLCGLKVGEIGGTK
ncbi:MAG: hypothetical protein Kow0099_07640 [Candidatus Abyssubacteria bacterium]